MAWSLERQNSYSVWQTEEVYMISSQAPYYGFEVQSV